MPAFTSLRPAQEASALTLESGKPVLAAPGFIGTDPALTADTLAQMVAAKQVRFVLGRGSGGMGGSSTSSVSAWVQAKCVASGLSGTLHDCAAQ